MIELPEAITLGKQANEILSGKIITQVFNATKSHRLTLYRGNPLEYGKLLLGKTFLSAKGYSTSVDMLLKDGMLLCIGNGTNIRYGKPGNQKPKNYQLLLTFDDDSFLVFTVSLYGSIGVYPNGIIDNKYHQLSKAGLSPLEKQFTTGYFDKLFAYAKATLTAKAFLTTDQRIPGVGNGISQDILFNAKIHPKQKVKTLSDTKKEDLFKSLKDTLIDMTFEGGRDTQTDLLGYNGGYKTLLSAKTWQKPCPCCGSLIMKESYLGGTIYYCTNCQKI